MKIRTLGALTVGLFPWIGACSDGSDTVELTPEASDVRGESGGEVPVIGLPRSWEAAEAEHYRKLSTPLSDEEQMELEELLIGSGIELERVTITGRMLLIDDILVDVDSLLTGTDAGEKGRTYAQINTKLAQGNHGGVQIGPHIYSRAASDPANPSGAYQFWRPYLSSTHYYVVPDNVPFLVPLFQSAIDTITSAANDCLNDVPNFKSLGVMTASQWISIGAGQAVITSTRVHWSGPTNFDPDDAHLNACGDSTGNAAGCSAFPRFGGIVVPPAGVQSTRMLPGPVMGLVQNNGLAGGPLFENYVNANNAKAKGIVMHEMLHTLGLGHIFEESVSDAAQPGIIVPGTSSSNTITALMQGKVCPPGSAGCTWSQTLTTEDVDTLDTLYSPVPGSTCAYQPNFQNTCWQGCARISDTSVADHCCYCNGVRKKFVRSTFSTKVYLCSG